MKRSHHLKFFFLILSCTLGLHAEDSEEKLLNALLQNYNQMIRPKLNHTIPTEVTIKFMPTKIVEVNEKSQSIKTFGWMSITWNDPKLVWNISDYSGLNYTRIYSDYLWTPDVMLNNAMETLTTLSSIRYSLLISSDGMVSWYPVGLFESRCSINVRNFPYDEQICKVIFASQSYFSDQLVFKNCTISLEMYENNTEWDLISFTSQYDYPCCPIYQEVQFVVRIKRKPLFVFFNMMVPCFFTIAVAMLAFLVSPASGEKMSIGITTLLSSSVLLLVISSELPRCSDYIPLIGIFYATSTAIIALICLASVFTLNLHHYGENGKELPICIQKIFFTIFGQIILFPRLVSFRKIKYNGKKFKKNEEIIKLQWTLIADIFDRLFFYIFSICTVSSMLAIINSRT